jgi:hypothetical protein
MGADFQTNRLEQIVMGADFQTNRLEQIVIGADFQTNRLKVVMGAVQISFLFESQKISDSLSSLPVSFNLKRSSTLADASNRKVSFDILQ